MLFRKLGIATILKKYSYFCNYDTYKLLKQKKIKFVEIVNGNIY